MKKLVSIIGINHNGKNFLNDFLNSLSNVDCNSISCEVILIDNPSEDDSVNFVRTGFPEIKIIENDINNYPKAINLGIKNAKGRYIAIIDTDTLVEKNWLKGLMEIADKDDKIGVVQSKILHFDETNIHSAGIKKMEDFHFRTIGFCEEDFGKYNEIRELDYFTDTSALIKKDCIDDVGEFDEDFFMRMEDVDYSIRCKELGWKIFYSPNSIVRCRDQRTTSALFDYFCSRNRLLLLGKHYPQRLAGNIKTSHFYIKKEYDNLYHSLIQATKKLAQNNDTETTRQTLKELSSTIPEIFGPQKAFNFFSQLEIALGLRRIRIGIYDHAFHVPGGGQRYGAEMAHILQDGNDVTYIANKEVSLEDYQKWFDIDLSKCKLKIIKMPFYEERRIREIDEGMVINQIRNPFGVIEKESIHYDIFINVNMLSKVKPLSILSVFICHFPSRDRERFFSADKYDYLITNSDYTTYWLNRKWSLDATARLYPPVDMSNDENGIGEKENIILSVARFEISGSKRQLEMIDAFSGLCEENRHIKEDWKLVLAGGTHRKNPYYKRVKEKSKEKDIDIEILGDLNNSEIKKLYEKASIFWHACGLNQKNPRLIEHFGMTTVEAMQNYCVPVVIDGGGQREIVEHGISGFRFTTEEELKSYTLKLISDDNLRNKMAKDAYARGQCFTKEKFRKNVLELFSDIENRLLGGEAVKSKKRRRVSN